MRPSHAHRAKSDVPDVLTLLLRSPVAPDLFPTSLTGVAAQGPIDLDTVAIPRHVLPISRLTEDPDWRTFPRHFF